VGRPFSPLVRPWARPQSGASNPSRVRGTNESPPEYDANYNKRRWKHWYQHRWRQHRDCERHVTHANTHAWSTCSSELVHTDPVEYLEMFDDTSLKQLKTNWSLNAEQFSAYSKDSLKCKTIDFNCWDNGQNVWMRYEWMLSKSETSFMALIHN